LEAVNNGFEQVIVAFWHDTYLPLFALFGGRRAVVLIAPGFRGDVIAGICRAFGYLPIHVGGPAKKSARETLKSALATEGCIAAVAIDGPTGPRHAPKLGALRLARDLSLVIVPTLINAWPRLILRYRWDHMQVPLPFAKVTLGVGDPIRIPLDGTGSDLNAAQIALTKALNAGSHA
jgi:lysophospholipid acyltransferase (LPLAT)-like uncharacterized protein